MDRHDHEARATNPINLPRPARSLALNEVKIGRPTPSWFCDGSYKPVGSYDSAHKPWTARL